ncbi:UvrD-helicase domain-containing protein [Actinopolyspora mortivallis]|uniref:UvrD-helicase domain-containing protein n=1 Tax=Actinopolyspora mortivallis TaxID=33906 RepID=UPI00047E8241|nr:UvrD-helicase domain-containing protein [Actinopolyspora mortivallis]
MARLGIDKDFLHEFTKLEKTVRDRVTRTLEKFEDISHAGAHLEKIANARDPRFRSIRISDFWRGIVLAPDSGDNYTLLTVRPHDDAYAWARRHRASVNAATGRIELRDVAAVEDSMPALSRLAETAPSRLFDHVKDSQLRQLGVDEQTLEFARVLTDSTQLEAAKSFLPSNQWDVLFGLAAGYTPEQVWAELAAEVTEAGFDTEDLDAAVERSSDRVVLVDGPEELMAIFRHPLATWRVYLHPRQRFVVEASYGGPARVTGGPGTGKTVVTMHRAHRLATNGEGPVLMTTFTATLADSLRTGVELLVEDPGVRERIDVRHVDQLANRIFREHHGPPTILSSEEERRLWDSVIAELEVPFTASFLGEEWRQVVLARRIGSAEEYLNAKRDGRGRGLGSRQKARVWQAVWEFENTLRRRGVWTHETVCVEATRLLEQRAEKPYRHVVVDEAQDLSPVQWRLLRAAVPELPNDVFLAGDTHQRIYNNRVSLREVGIQVVGRSSRLTVNYRTTAEILAWSLGLLRGERIDDMDEGLASIAGCRSEVRGRHPRVLGFPTRNAETEHLVTTVREWMDAGVQPGEIGVAVRSNRLVDTVMAALAGAGVPHEKLFGATGGDEQAVAVGTMHRMKGLEFRCLAVVGVTEYHVPPASAITPEEEDPAAHRRDTQRERCLLFVACTRAREQLVVSWHGSRSPFLPVEG